MALTDNLVSYWKFDESSGNAADSVGSNELLAYLIVTYVSGKINNGAFIDPFNYGYFKKAVTTGLPTNTNPFSITLWVKTDVSAASFNHLVGWGTIGANQPIVFGIEKSSGTSGKLTLRNYNVSIQIAESSDFSWSTSTWYFLCCTYDGTTVRLYRNGSEIGNGTTSGFTQDNSALLVGANLYGGYPINGTIDETGIWSRELTPTEVTALYNSGSGIQYPFTPPTSIKTFNGLVVASVKTVNGTAKASIKTINSLN